jgi:hypothetical protein
VGGVMPLSMSSDLCLASLSSFIRHVSLTTFTIFNRHARAEFQDSCFGTWDA